MALVDLVEVSKCYPGSGTGWRRGLKTVADRVSLTIERGETLGLVGESGSGKSTVARMLLGLVMPTSGEIRVDGTPVTGGRMLALRRRMQPVFQDPAAALNPRMTVRAIVTEPLVIHGRALGLATSRQALDEKARALLGAVGLDGSALERFPHEFSGGQKQRINIARALALTPEILVLDEPVSALDVSVGAQVVNLLRSLQREHRLTYLFISHSMPLVRYLSTRIAVMERGRLVEVGETEQLCAAPRETYTRQLLEATPEL